MSAIEWTKKTLNIFTGCKAISAGCKNCYAEEMTRRLSTMDSTKSKYGGLLTENNKFNGVVKFHEETIIEPFLKKKPDLFFINSMSDTFNEKVPFDWIDKIFAMIALNPQHIFIVLTKRSEIMKEYFKAYSNNRIANVACEMVQKSNALNKVITKKAIDILNFDNYKLPLRNLWLMVTVENQNHISRINDLIECNAIVKGLSCEPLLSDLDFTNVDLSKIDWCIVGGESSKSKPREMDKKWVVNIQNQCNKYNVPFFFKQWGGRNKQKTGRLLDGIEYNEMPKNFKF